MINKNKSVYDNWNNGEISGFGSFHTTLLNAYKLADSGNREQLEIAFPDWFLPQVNTDNVSRETITNRNDCLNYIAEINELQNARKSVNVCCYIDSKLQQTMLNVLDGQINYLLSKVKNS